MPDDPNAPQNGAQKGGEHTVRIKVEGGGGEPNGATPNARPSGDDAHQKQLSDIRAEAAAHRIEARKEREAREKAEAERDAARAEIDGKLKTERDTATARITKMQQRVIESDLKAQAVAAGLEDLDLLPLLDRSGINMDDDGNVTGIKEAIEAFKAKKPDYFKKEGGKKAAGNGDGGAKKPTGDGGAPPPNKEPPSDNVKKMTRAEYQAWKQSGLRKMRGLPSRA